MNIPKFFRLGFAAIVCATPAVAALAQKKACPAVEANIQDARFKPGQVWAMLTSTDHLIRTEKQLPSLDGYEIWRHDCGGVYTISVRDAVDFMQKAFDAR